jgi:hypothetical protein
MSASPAPPSIFLPELATPPALAFVPNPLSEYELRQVADFLADFLLYDIEVAMQHSASWYRNQVGEDVCSISRAIRLRQLTIEVCCSAVDQALEDEPEDSEASEFWMAAQIGLKFLLAFVVLAGVWLTVCVTWVEGGSR